MGLFNLAWWIPGLLTAIVFHEYAHAWTSSYLGDPTPRYTGRLTLNPLAHIDPIGLLMLLIFRFGWAKPVQINPYYYKDWRRGTLLVSIAGPGANLVLAFLAIGIGKVLGLAPYGVGDRMLSGVAWLNIYFAVFNLIPIPPLDGSKVLRSILPEQYAGFYNQLEGMGWLLLVFLLMTGAVSRILFPVSGGIYRLFNLITG